MNLYRINSKYITADDIAESLEWYALMENEEQVYKLVEEEYGFTCDNPEYIMENQGELTIYNDDFDSYYQSYVYGWELVDECVTYDQAMKMVWNLHTLYTLNK